jgi:branched-chain amino acid aminotransferase
MNIQITKVAQSRIADAKREDLPFGKIFSDHMLVAEYCDGQWKEPAIMPFGKIEISPSLTALHHGQSIFEGMKVFLSAKGDPLFFRLRDNFKRMNQSAERMCMPPIPEEYFVEGLKQLIALDRDWIPEREGYSLYIRPVYFSADEVIGVKPAENYTFIILTTPTGPYFTEPLRTWVETKYSRSAEGGTGYAKAAGNYGGAMYPTRLANQRGFHQIIWTDAKENKWIEESGAMNLMMMVDGVLWTPALSHSKLAGITRDSILKIAKSWGTKIEERNISIDEVVAAYHAGKLQECFGVGTAANVAPIKVIGHGDLLMELSDPAGWTFATKLKSYLLDYKRGVVEDIFGWREGL